ncbi:CDP-diacylglycerol--glycerol-3-phosphate 3-phosphatidyltransferase [Microbaculum marinum]|uniref:CDP-diacylglycerol--glycerol-3-phosphate 3-phosphatidyltransferase n=1 Tax=Microbaculum marinum TaxID=1764581 RepID=A0AAW9RX84_9HYPH
MVTESMTTTTQARGHAMSLPNILTYARIAAVPAMVACFYIDGYWANWLALTLFVAACITDYLDGYLARIWQQQSALGRMLDPIADKLLVAAALIMLVDAGTIGGWSLLAAVIILSREILVSGLREFLAELRVSVPVTNLAKWKTTMQMVAIGFLIAGPAGDDLIPGVSLVGLTLLWLSAILTLYTGWDYFRAGVRHAMEE